MKIIGKPSRRGERSEEFALSSSRPIGGAREFTTFALLMLCLAVTVAVVFGHRHRSANGAKSQPVIPAHRAVAPNPNPRSEPPIAPAPNYTAKDYTDLMNSTAGSLGNSAMSASNVVVSAVVSLVWDPALGLSNQIVGFVADSWVNPVSGDRIIFNAAPGTTHMAVAILAMAMVGVVMMVLAGPIYVSWKSWRLSREHAFRNRSN